MHRFFGNLSKIVATTMVCAMVCSNNVIASQLGDSYPASDEEMLVSEDSLDGTDGTTKDDEILNEDIPDEASDVQGTGGYKPVLELYYDENSFFNTNGVSFTFKCHPEMEKYIVMYSLDGVNYSEGRSLYSYGMDEINDFAHIPEMQNLETGNYKKTYLYVIARDEDGVNPDVKSDVIIVDENSQKSSAASAYSKIVYLQYDQQGNYTPIDKLTIHVGEDIKLGVGLKKTSGEIIPLQQEPEIKAFLDNTNPFGYFNDPRLKTSWGVALDEGGGIHTIWDNVDNYDISCIDYDNELKGDHSIYQYIEGVKTSETQYFLSVDSIWGVDFPLKIMYSYLPVTVLPAEPGVKYFKVDRGIDDTTIYRTRKEALDKMRELHVNRDTNTKEGVTMLTAQGLFSEDEKEDILYLIFDQDNERDDMKPYEGDYLHCSIGLRDNPQFKFTNEWTNLTIDGEEVDKYTFRTTFITTREEEDQVDEFVQNLFKNNETLRSAKNSTSNEEKAQAAFGWTISHVSSATGDRTRPIVHTAYNAFVGDHTGTCEAYALVYARLCREMGVPVKIIMGTDYGAHTYTITKMDDGCYYYVDPSAGIWKQNYTSFARAEEQEQYRRERFIYNYMRKVKGYPGSTYNPAEEDFKGRVYMSLILGDEIGMKFTVSDYDDYTYAEFICGNKHTYVPLDSESQTLEYVNMLPVKNLNMGVELKLYKDNPKSNPSAKSVQLGPYTIATYYEEAKRRSDNPKLFKLLETLMTYGDCGDNYFNNASNTIDRTNIDKVTAQQTKDYARVVTAGNSDVNYIGSSLVLEGSTCLKFYYKLKDSAESNTIVEYRIEGGDGYFYQFASDSISKEDGIYCVRYPRVSLADLNKKITVRFRNATTGATTDVTFGGLTYANEVLTKSSNQSLKDLVKAMYVTHKAAEDYFDGWYR